MRFVNGAPLFAVEARSENDYGPASDRAYTRKRTDYFAAGTHVVWEIDRIAKIVTSYRHDRPDEPVIFRIHERANADPALPGWSVAVDEIFSDD
jgi:Uma2 family endonuclease